MRSIFKPICERWRVNMAGGLSLLAGLPIFLKRMIVISLGHKENAGRIMQNNYIKVDGRLADL